MPSIKSVIRHAHGRMLIRRRGVWFIDIPRTSSSSIRVELAQAFGYPYGKSNLLETALSARQLYRDHLPAFRMKELLGDRLWRRIFTFAIVRNPWDRTVSMYHYRRLVGEIPGDLDFTSYVRALSDAGSGRAHELFPHPYAFAGCSYYVHGAQGEPLVDCIVRYEDRDRGLAEVARRIGVDRLGQLQTQRAAPPDRHYATFFDETTRDIVAAKYKDDLEQFGYDFEPAP